MLQRRADDTDIDDNVDNWDNDGVYWWYTDVSAADAISGCADLD
jgi:hypothetical protein